MVKQMKELHVIVFVYKGSVNPICCELPITNIEAMIHQEKCNDLKGVL